MAFEPDQQTLLAAVIRFLEDKVRPAVNDPAVAFRLKIATHLLEIIGREQAAGPSYLAEDAERLRALVGASPDPQAALLDRIEAGDLGPEVRGYLLASLAGELQINQPRFNLALDLESP